MNNNNTDNFEMLTSQSSVSIQDNFEVSDQSENIISTSYISNSVTLPASQSSVKGFDPSKPEVKQAVEQLDPKLAYISSDGKVYPTYESSPDYQQELLETRHAYNDIEFKRK